VSPVFVVILDASLNGSSFCTTEDVIEAESAERAEAKAIAAWCELEPRLTFRPLLTLQQS
jgi:hypothetical protein